jgi:hypothetical protein
MGGDLRLAGFGLAHGEITVVENELGSLDDS